MGDPGAGASCRQLFHIRPAAGQKARILACALFISCGFGAATRETAKLPFAQSISPGGRITTSLRLRQPHDCATSGHP